MGIQDEEHLCYKWFKNHPNILKPTFCQFIEGKPYYYMVSKNMKIDVFSYYNQTPYTPL